MLSLTSRLARNGITRQLARRLVAANSYAVSGAGARRHASIDAQLQLLDNEVRRTGRVSIKDVTSIFESMKKAKSTSSTQALLLIRCCGTLMAEASPQVRTQLISEIWDTLAKNETKFQIAHYNALLKVYLDNDQEFNPTEFLDQLAATGIEPNHVTYQRLIHRYAQLGDIAGATKILEFMKTKSMPLTEAVFGSIILGYGKANDLTAARGTLDVMRSTGLEPGADTYVALLKVFSKKAVAESTYLPTIDDVVTEAKNNDVFLTDENVLEIIRHVAIEADEEAAVPILDRLFQLCPKGKAYNQDCYNTCLQLVNANKINLASRVFNSMSTSEVMRERKTNGMFFVVQLVRANIPPESVFSICSQLKESGQNPYAFSKAAKVAIETSDFETTRKYIQRFVKECDDQIDRAHYYWPMIAKCTRDEDLLDIIYTDMKNLTVTASMTTLLDTFGDYIWPRVQGDKLDFLNNCVEAGFSQAMLFSSLAIHHLNRNEIKEAEAIIRSSSGSNLRLVCRTMPVVLANAFIRTGDIDATVSIMKQAFRGPMQGGGINEDFDGRFLTTVALNPSKVVTQEKMEDLLNKMLQNKIFISRAAEDTLKSRSDLKEEQYSKLVTGEYVDTFTDAIRSDNLEKAMEIRKSLEKSGEQLYIGQEGQLVEKLLAKQELSKATEIAKNLLSTGRYLYPRVLRQVVQGMSQAGLIAEIEDLTPHLPAEFKNQSWFTNAVANTYLTAGKAEQLIQEILPKLTPFPLWSVAKIMDAHPEMEQLLLAMANKMAETNGYHLPQNMMLLYYLKSNRFDDAQALFNSNPKFKDSLLYTSIIDYIRKENNTKVARNLLRLVEQTNLQPRSLGIVYSAYIDALVELNKPEEAENLILNEINTASPRKTSAGDEIRAVSLRDINRMALIRLRHLINDTLQREAKFEIPEKGSNEEANTAPLAEVEEEAVADETDRKQVGNV